MPVSTDLFFKSVMAVLLLVFIYGAAVPASDKTEADKFAPVMPVIETCAACHGPGGLSVIPQNPILAGQHLNYIYVQLKDFKAGRRENAIMTPLAQGLEKEQMLLIAEYYSKQEWPQSGAGEAISPETELLAKQVITAGQCVQCHFGGFEGTSGVPRSDGQHFEYLQKTLLDFKTRARNNAAAKSSLMGSFSDEEISAVAKYLSTLN